MDSNFWDNIYNTKTQKQQSWFQENPQVSLDILAQLNLQSQDPIIDIGGGDSLLVDALMKLNFSELSVLDISQVALDKAKNRLGAEAHKVKFIHSNVTKFSPSQKYKLWHDRAAFHFLTTDNDRKKYLNVLNSSLQEGGYLLISTFAKNGPEKCSGLPITQHNEDDFTNFLGPNFQKIKCVNQTHNTPWGSTQNFIYCLFRKNI